MSQEDLDLLKAVAEWKPPKSLHPIAMHAWLLYEQKGLTLPDESVQELREILNAYGDDLKSLAEALEGLTRFMILLKEHQKDEAGSDKIVDLMMEYKTKFEPFWERVGEALTNVGATAKETFNNFVDTEEAKAAPAPGDKPPDGAVPMSNIVNPARPPPWAKKKKGSE